MYRETKPGSQIWEIKDEVEYPDGWYYSDETDSFACGPFLTEELCRQKLKEYCDWLESPASNKR